MALAAIAGSAHADLPTLKLGSQAEAVSVMRGAEVIKAVDIGALLDGDLILSSQDSEYTLQLENCVQSVSGEAVVKVSDVSCQSDGRTNTDAYVFLGFAAIVGAVMMFGDFDNDEFERPAPPRPVSP